MPTPAGAPDRVSELEASSIQVLGASVSADWIRVGHSTTVQVGVYNSGNRSEIPLVVTHAGNEVAVHNVTVGATRSAEFKFVVVFEEPATGALEVNGVPAGELIVGTGPDEDDDTPITPAETEDQSGFGFKLALLGVLAAALWIRRR